MDILIFLDSSMFILLLVLANLSCRIGEAMMIPKYYKVFYYQAAVLALVALTALFFNEFLQIEEKSSSALIRQAKTVFMILRAVVTITALPVCFRYWKWLFVEELKG